MAALPLVPAFVNSFMATTVRVEKNVFVVFFSGERAKSKVLKICEAFAANRYPLAEDIGKQEQMITKPDSQLATSGKSKKS